ncbi:arylamine N-acetyltransferase [Sphingomonas piscis]|uniref:Arylamine N-acetyltransferase n=1 Tax=Sphingomonas piscis TaxID=2714943 RepID=A0A6G7YPE5_9SPHN|nr:arylamine N-acetyltransferase [Sphingomonas piscis]QIK78618.1 arylamine N-acetyltransferase [Sphingomonas piscis]
MSLSAADLQAYLIRIGFEGEARADRETLARIVALHPGVIPFENLNPFLGIPVELTADAFMAKLVHGGRGGYCFEQNGLLAHVLETLGFKFTPLAARVLWMQDEDAETPRTHKLLMVDLPDGPVLADVGFGGAVCTGLLRLESGVPQETPHERFRLLEKDGEWRQQIEIRGEWRTTYRFTLEQALAIDDALGNWWTSTSPASHFTFSLVAARSPAGRRLALRNLDYTTHQPGEDTQRRRLAPDEVCAVLESDFGLRLADRDNLTAKIRTLA